MSDVLIKLTGLWQRERRGNPGNTYWVGRLGAAKILVFKNNRKEKPDDPDFNIFLTEPPPPRQEQRTESPQRTGPGVGLLAGAGRCELLATEPIPENGDELPFLMRSRARANAEIRRCRQRQRAGLIRLTAWARGGLLIDVLVAASYAPRQSVSDRKPEEDKRPALTAAHDPSRHGRCDNEFRPAWNTPTGFAA